MLIRKTELMLAGLVLATALMPLKSKGSSPGQSQLLQLASTVEAAVKEKAGIVLTNRAIKEAELYPPGSPAAPLPTPALPQVSYSFQVDEKVGYLSVMRCGSARLAEEHLEDLIRRVSIPPRALPNVGDKAVIGVDEGNPERVGSLFFRRGPLVVHLNAGRTSLAKQIAEALDSAFLETLRHEASRSSQ